MSERLHLGKQLLTRTAILAATTGFLMLVSTGCIPFYGEATGGLHSVSGDAFDARFAPSAGVGFGLPLYFGAPIGGSIGAGVDMMVVDLPTDERLKIWSGGLVLRLSVNPGCGGFVCTGDIIYSAPGETGIDDGKKGGSASGLFIGGTFGASELNLSLGPHFVFGSHETLGSIFAWGGQLRIRYMSVAQF